MKLVRATNLNRKSGGAEGSAVPLIYSPTHTERTPLPLCHPDQSVPQDSRGMR
jgi:hypothetical protein